MKSKFKEILVLVLISFVLVSCKNKPITFNKQIDCFDITIPVLEKSNFNELYSSNNLCLFYDEDLDIYISVGKTQYSTNVPNFKEMANKIENDFNRDKETEAVVNEKNKTIIINKDLKNSTKYDDGDYNIAGLYLNNDAYYCVIFYGKYKSMFDNHEWIIESLKQLDFKS